MDQRTCIKFCVKNEIKCADAFRMLTVAYGEATLDRSNRAGRPSTSTTDEKINEVEKMILANRRITVREVAEDLNISIGSCHSIFINDLGMRRVAAKFVPKLLNCDQKQHRMNIANEMLDSVRDDPNLLQRVITGDEAWVYGYDVETKAQSSQWKLPHEPRPKKARQVRSNVKVLLTVFFDCRGVVHHEFLPQGRTVNKEYYLQVMRNLREAIRQKRPDLWKNKNWLLHHDNAPAHTSLLVRDFLAKNNTLMMPQPPYSPDLAPIVKIPLDPVWISWNKVRPRLTRAISPKPWRNAEAKNKARSSLTKGYDLRFLFGTAKVCLLGNSRKECHALPCRQPKDLLRTTTQVDLLSSGSISRPYHWWEDTRTYQKKGAMSGILSKKDYRRRHPSPVSSNQETHPYNGNSSNCPQQWLKDFDRVAKYNGWDDSLCLENVILFLDGTVKCWFENVEEYNAFVIKTGSTTQWQADLAPKEMTASDMRNRRHRQPLLTWSTNAAYPRLTPGFHRRVKAKTSLQDDDVPIDDTTTKPFFMPQEKGRKGTMDKVPRLRWNPWQSTSDPSRREEIEGKETTGINRRSKPMDWTTHLGGDEEDGGGPESMERPCGLPSVEEGIEGGSMKRPCGPPSEEEGIEGGR
ncbi:hypothetical protein LAZ67_12002717 [Cordylochernes scorpioides]|uniref:Transposase n=1 Tax=Cordylochernes scorpioides TaxID=51811 RepID=A0ABY6L4F6_9ARAC|nr:hypothetical protein LAZ67_12002717 [Cordylochernes scorpioides]